MRILVWTARPDGALDYGNPALEEYLGAPAETIHGTGWHSVVYADDLPAGHYRLIYAAQVISPGRFLAPPPKVREIYQPDVFGRGRAEFVEVGSER